MRLNIVSCYSSGIFPETSHIIITSSKKENVLPKFNFICWNLLSAVSLKSRLFLILLTMKITFGIMTEVVSKPEEQKRQAAISPFYEGNLLIQGITMIDVEKTSALGEISISEVKSKGYKISTLDVSRSAATT